MGVYEMRKKFFGIFVSVLFISSILATSVAAISISNNKSYYDVNASDGPLDAFIEVEEIESRVLNIKIIVKNIWDEQVIVRYNGDSIISYVIRLGGEFLPVYMSVGPNPILGQPIIKKFAPMEEKIVHEYIFRGLSNMPVILKMPEGDYDITGGIAYKYGVKLLYSYAESEPVRINLPPPKSKGVTKSVTNNREINNLNNDGPSIVFTFPKEGYTYFFGRELMPTSHEYALVIGQCSFALSGSTDIITRKNKYYIDDVEIEEREFGLRNGLHNYRIEVFNAQDESASDDIDINARVSHGRVRIFQPLLSLLLH